MSFESIWKEYERELSSFVLSRVKDIEVQKEIMQEIALKVFVSLHSQKKHLRGWLYQITKNAILDYYRKENKPLPIIEEEIQEHHPLTECLVPIMEKLSEEEYEVLKLSQIEQYSLKEIVKIKNIPFNTIKSQIFRAKKHLSQLFFQCCEYEYDKEGRVIDYNKCNTNCG